MAADVARGRNASQNKSQNRSARRVLQCLAITYDKHGRHVDAEAVLGKFKAAFGNAFAYQYATIYAQWGNSARALEWLGVLYLKTDPLMDPLRNEPSFQAAERRLKFPN
jgi:hypothetical protein